MSCLAGCLSGCAADASEPGVAREAIVDGSPDDTYPGVVFLWNRDGPSCTATLIAPRLLLTAKHCTEGVPGTVAPPSSFRAYLGSSALQATEEHFVTEIRVAPGAWDFSDASDLALLFLAAPASVPPLELSFSSPASLAGTSVTVVGYGETPSGSSGTRLSATHFVSAVDAGHLYVEPSICLGDSGGPLIASDGRVYGIASFVYTQGGVASPTCGSAPAAYNTLDAHQSLIETALLDAGACLASVEQCNGLDDDCDGLLDEDCQPLGASCTDNAQCYGGLCAPTPAGTICTLPCDPLRPTLGCAPGFYCANVGGCEGRCTPGVATEPLLDLDEPCDLDTDCVSLFCNDPGDGLRRCVPPCEAGTAGCMADEVCAATVGQCGACLDPALVSGPRALGEPCADDADCLSNVCIQEAGTAYCSTGCTADPDCADGFHCRPAPDPSSTSPACIRGPRQGLGGACITDTDCLETHCIERSAHLRFCSRPCTTDADCPADFTCDPARSASFCEPQRALIGERCNLDTECQSAFCPTDGLAADHCTRLCNPDTPCAPGEHCQRDQGGRRSICLPALGLEPAGCTLLVGTRPKSGFGLLLISVVLFLPLRRRLGSRCWPSRRPP